MSNYTKTTDFAAKDSLPSGDSGKIIRGSEFETEFDNISTAIATKSDTASPTFTGTVTIPTLSVTGNTTLGNAATDTVTVTADIASNLIPSADDTYNLGASGAEWNDLYVDGVAYIDTIDGAATSGDFTFTGASYNAVWDSSDNALEFADNARLKFGAGNDLLIYHDGSESIIRDAGAGNLNLRGNSVSIANSDASKSFIEMNNGSGAVSLYHANAEKFQTTSTGIDVTGTVTADGLTVDGNVGISNSSPSEALDVVGRVLVTQGGGSGGTANTDAKELVIDGAGTTGISILAVDDPLIRLGNTTDGSSAIVRYDTATDVFQTGPTKVGSQHVLLSGNGTAAVRIDANGLVGINKSSPSTILDVNGDITTTNINVAGKVSIGGATPRIELMESDTTDLNTRIRNTSGTLQIQTTTDDLATNKIRLAIDHSDGEFALYNTDGVAKRLVWDAVNLRVGVGKSVPLRTLDVNGDADMADLYLSGGAYLGTTAAANYLDDYEEGSFDPEIADAASGGNTGTATTIEGRYTKVGRQIVVTIKIEDIDTTGMTGANNIFIRGLPFTAGSGTTGQSEGSLRLDRIDLDANCCGIVSSTTSNSTYLTLRQTVDNSADVQIKVQDFTSGSADMFTTITYFE